MRVVSLKIGLGVVLAIIAIELLQTTAVLNAIMLFGAAGVVPGTDVVLSPDGTIYAMGGVLIAAFLLIFRRNIIDLFSPRPISDEEFIAAITNPKPEIVVVEDIPVAADVAVAAKPRKHLHIALPAMRLPKPHITLPAIPVAKFAKALGGFAKRHGSRLRPAIALVARRFAQLAKLLGTYVAAAWQWLMPRVQAFDKFATARLRRHGDVAAVMDLLRQCTKVLASWWADTRAQVIRAFTKTTE